MSFLSRRRLNNSSAFSYGTPTTLLDSDGRWSVSGVDSRPYDVSLDGRRFLTIRTRSLLTTRQRPHRVAWSLSSTGVKS